MDALNPKRYRIEHYKDVNEATLRANFMHAHVLIVHANEVNASLRALETDDEGRVERVLISEAPAVQQFARQIGAQFVSEPFERQDLKRAVYRAVKLIEHRRKNQGPRSVRNEAPSILVLLSSKTAGDVVAGVLRSALGCECTVVTDLFDALVGLEHTVGCVVTETSLMAQSPEARQFAKAVAKRAIGVIPVRSVDAADEEAIGRLAWDLVPKVRLSLNARTPIPPAGPAH